jgi:hypothetical protein
MNENMTCETSAGICNAQKLGVVSFKLLAPEMIVAK